MSQVPTGTGHPGHHIDNDCKICDRIGGDSGSTDAGGDTAIPALHDLGKDDDIVSDNDDNSQATIHDNGIRIR